MRTSAIDFVNESWSIPVSDTLLGVCCVDFGVFSSDTSRFISDELSTSCFI